MAQRTITNKNELDSLPFGSIIRDDEGDAWQKFITGWTPASSGEWTADDITFPAIVWEFKA